MGSRGVRRQRRGAPPPALTGPLPLLREEGRLCTSDQSRPGRWPVDTGVELQCQPPACPLPPPRVRVPRATAKTRTGATARRQKAFSERKNKDTCFLFMEM